MVFDTGNGPVIYHGEQDQHHRSQHQILKSPYRRVDLASGAIFVSFDAKITGTGTKIINFSANGSDRTGKEGL